MDPATLILKKTFPGDQKENIQAIETLLAKEKSELKAFRAKNCLPFKAFDEVPESDGGKNGEEEKPFLQCIYNNADRAHRSPWTNRWYLIKDVGGGEEEIEVYEKDIPRDEVDLRSIEKAANEVWEAYTQLYYGKEGIGSVFLKPKNAGTGKKSSAFEGIFGIQKKADEASGGGTWDSAHFVYVEEVSNNATECEYRVESAVLVTLTPYEDSVIGCTLTKETVKTCKVRASNVVSSHLENLGTIIETVEIDFRSKMERVDIPKSMEVIQSIYRKQKAGATAHLINPGIGMPGMMMGGEPSMATGMGVGASMIGEIANKAKAKKGAGGGPNPFMEAMQANLKKREEEQQKKDGDDGGHYVDLKKTLKKSPNPLAAEAMAGMKKKEGGDGTFDFKAGLKKSTGAKKPAAAAPASDTPTPEFMNFRNKLKKSG